MTRMRLETTYETRGQDKFASASIQTYDDMETFETNLVNGKQSRSCETKEILVNSWE